MDDFQNRAEELAARPYKLLIFPDLTTDEDDYVFVAMNPEIEGCKAQGLTMEEAQDNLDEVRIDLIEHLLNHNLPVPDPVEEIRGDGNLIESFFLYTEPSYQEQENVVQIA